MITIKITDNREAEPKSEARTLLGYPDNHAVVQASVMHILMGGFSTGDVLTIDEQTGVGRVGFNSGDDYDVVVLEASTPTTEQSVECITSFLDVKVLKDDMYDEIQKVIDLYFSTPREAIANDPDSFSIGPIDGRVLQDNPTAFCSPEWTTLMCRDYLLVGLDHLNQYEELPLHLWDATIKHYQTRLQDLGAKLAEHYRNKFGEMILAPEVVQGWIQMYNDAWDGFVASEDPSNVIPHAVEETPTLH